MPLRTAAKRFLVRIVAIRPEANDENQQLLNQLGERQRGTLSNAEPVTAASV